MQPILSPRSLILAAFASQSIFGLSLPVQAANISYTFTKIADTNTPVPSGIGNFDHFLESSPTSSGSRPALHNGEVAFFGVAAGDLRGMYKSSGGSLVMFANESTPIPTRPNFTFTNFGDPDIENGQVVFLGSGGTVATYVKGDENSLDVIVDSSTQVPGQNFNFAPSFPPAINGGEVVFTSFNRGIYVTNNGAIDTVVDGATTLIPGTNSNFSINSSQVPDIDHGRIVFRGQGVAVGTLGIYRSVGGVLSTLVDVSDIAPGATLGDRTFTSFGTPVTDGGLVAFDAGYNGGSGIFILSDQSIQLIANNDADLPDPILSIGAPGAQFGNAFGDVAISDGAIAFTAVTSGALAGQWSGIYSTIGGSLGTVIDADDTLDGKALQSFVIGQHSLDRNTLAFFARFEDGSEGIYTATATVVPLPSAIWLFGVASMGLMGLTKSRIKGVWIPSRVPS